MAYTVTLQDNLYVLRFSGEITAADLVDLAREIAEIDRVSPVALHRLTDVRASTGIRLDFAAMLQLSQSRNAVVLPNPVKSALVATDPIHYGFMRMYQMLVRNPAIYVAIFPTDASARAWLAEPGVAPPADEWDPARGFPRE